MSGTAATAEGDEKSAYINLKVIGQVKIFLFGFCLSFFVIF